MSESKRSPPTATHAEQTLLRVDCRPSYPSVTGCSLRFVILRKVAGMGDPDADGGRTRAARRPVPAVPFGRGLVLLAGRRAVRRCGGAADSALSRRGARPGAALAVRDAMSTASAGQVADCRSPPWPCPPARSPGLRCLLRGLPDYAGGVLVPARRAGLDLVHPRPRQRAADGSDLGLGALMAAVGVRFCGPAGRAGFRGPARAVRAGGLARSRELAGADSA